MWNRRSLRWRPPLLAPVTESFDSGNIEDRAMNEEEDSMVVPPSVMT
jgi:hypothetical protein